MKKKRAFLTKKEKALKRSYKQRHNGFLCLGYYFGDIEDPYVINSIRKLRAYLRYYANLETILRGKNGCIFYTNR